MKGTRTIRHVVAATLLLGSACLAALPQYQAIDMGAGWNTVPYAINNAGQIVGVFEGRAAFRDADGSILDLQTLFGVRDCYDIYFGGINDSGVVALTADQVAYRWSLATGPTRLADLTLDFGKTRGINNRGDIAGWFDATYSHAVLWKGDGRSTDLGLRSAADVNDSGQAVGAIFEGEHAGSVVWNPDGSITMIDGCGPYAINAVGEIAGAWHACAVYWSEETGSVELPELGGHASSGFDINASGLIAGQSRASYGYDHAVAWDTDLAIHDLGVLPGYLWSKADSVNDAGWIVGSCTRGTCGAFESRATLWIPVPEPSCLSFLTFALTGLGIGKLRRRQ